MGDAYWRRAETFRTLNTAEWLFDEAERSIEAGSRVGDDPQIRLVMTPVMVESREGTVRHPLAMLVTADVVVVSRRKGAFGRRGDIRQWARSDFMRYGVGPWQDVGPHFEVRTDHERLGRIVFVFSSPHEAEALAAYFANR